MSKTIKISVRDKIAVNMSGGVSYTCGNSDFVINFDFDAEWDEFSVKTARFIKDDRKYQDVEFQGNECPVPILYNTNKVRVGVFAGNLHTSTPAIISANKSILCLKGSPEAPTIENPNGTGTGSNGKGLTETEMALILSLFKNAAYTANMSATIAQLETLWSGGGDNNGDDTHTHSYTSLVTKAATCTTAGIRAYTCSCGHSYTDSIPATGHNYVDGVCANCGATSDSGTTEATGEENVVVTGATVTDDGNGNVTVIGLTATDDGNGNVVAN